MKKLGRGIVLATAATLLVTTHAFAKDDATSNQAKPVKCHGINSCRGKGSCGTKGANACSGQNTCKGKGWMYTSPEQCKVKGGTAE